MNPEGNHPLFIIALGVLAVAAAVIFGLVVAGWGKRPTKRGRL